MDNVLRFNGGVAHDQNIDFWLAERGELVPVVLTTREPPHVEEGHRLHGHALIGAMKEEAVDAAIVGARGRAGLGEHVLDRVHRLVEGALALLPAREELPQALLLRLGELQLLVRHRREALHLHQADSFAMFL